MLINPFLFAKASVPLPTMTGSNTPAGYAATASTDTPSTYVAWRAFDGNLSSLWQSQLGDYDNTTGAYSGSNTLGSETGDWIKLEMPIAREMSSVRLRTRTTGFWDLFRPITWKVLVSSDDVSWVVVHSQTTDAFTETEGVELFTPWISFTPMTGRFIAVSVQNVYNPDPGNASAIGGNGINLTEVGFD